ncbi:cell division protein FtsQ/DivIB [Erythrobacter sp. EC-HK427]|uniref:cell division protein FtsQ/DivIB n=1 Tax=Erythrobacter sp. EC-HK427 TaxID=2038396 RepID=UPI00125C8192|nr:FtsQ-type POTRA domain-containing protein [Erythrobacter sp. EC-HK427]VVS97438.1 Cell division protein FtsQ [Erythrobacter sp. EC-HK427]
MARKVTRNTKGVRRQARAQDTRQRARRARSTGQSIIGRGLALLPFTEAQLQKTFTLFILAAAAALALFIANVSGATTVVSERFAHVASNAGYKVQHIQPRGVERMNVQTVYERALGQQNLAMTHVDLQGLREELLELPWVRDARVSRQLPDTLVIDIIEREPHAVLARPDRLMLIDPTGVELEPISGEAASEYLRIEGPGAQDRVEDLTRLLDAAPALQSQITGAEWIGNRRWNLTFATDQRLALPEGEDRAAAALISFAQADGVHRLIGGQAASFDMRNAPRMYMSIPGRSEAQEVSMEEESS